MQKEALPKLKLQQERVSRFSEPLQHHGATNSQPEASLFSLLCQQPDQLFHYHSRRESTTGFGEDELGSHHLFVAADKENNSHGWSSRTHLPITQTSRLQDSQLGDRSETECTDNGIKANMHIVVQRDERSFQSTVISPRMYDRSGAVLAQNEVLPNCQKEFTLGADSSPGSCQATLRKIISEQKVQLAQAEADDRLVHRFDEDEVLNLSGAQRLRSPAQTETVEDHCVEAKEMSKSQLMIQLDGISTCHNDNDDRQSNQFPPSTNESQMIDLLNGCQAQTQINSNTMMAIETQSSHASDRQRFNSKGYITDNYFSTTTSLMNQAQQQQQQQQQQLQPQQVTRVAYNPSASLPPKQQQKKAKTRSETAYTSQSQKGIARSSRSTRQPQFSPIHERRTEEEKERAREKTLQRKRALKERRELNQAAMLTFTEMVDGQTAVAVYQTYYESCMQWQAQKVALQGVVEDTVLQMTQAVAVQCCDHALAARREAQSVAGGIMSYLLANCYDQIAQSKPVLVREEVREPQSDISNFKQSLTEISVIGLNNCMHKQENGQVVNRDLVSPCESLPSKLFFTSAQPTERQQTSPNCELENSHSDSVAVAVPFQDDSKQTKVAKPMNQNTFRDTLANQMSAFACATVEDRIVDELTSNAVQEHLLLEFAFEAVLKSLLGESSQSVKKQEVPDKKPARQKSRIPTLSPRPASLTKQGREGRSFSQYLTSSKTTSPMSRLRLPTNFQPEGDQQPQQQRLGKPIQVYNGAGKIQTKSTGSHLKSTSSVESATKNPRIMHCPNTARSQQSSLSKSPCKLNPARGTNQIVHHASRETQPTRNAQKVVRNQMTVRTAFAQAQRARHTGNISATSPTSPAAMSLGSQRLGRVASNKQMVVPEQRKQIQKDRKPLFKSIPLSGVGSAEVETPVPDIASPSIHQSKKSQHDFPQKPSCSNRAVLDDASQIYGQSSSAGGVEIEATRVDEPQLSEKRPPDQVGIHLLGVRKVPSTQTQVHSILHMQRQLSIGSEASLPSVSNSMCANRKQFSFNASSQIHHQSVDDFATCLTPIIVPERVINLDENFSVTSQAAADGHRTLEATNTNSILQPVPRDRVRVINLDKSHDEMETSKGNLTQHQTQRLLYSTRISKHSGSQAKKQVLIGDQSNQQTRNILKMLKRRPLQNTSSARPRPDSTSRTSQGETPQLQASTLRKNTSSSALKKQRTNVDRKKHTSSVSNASDTNKSATNLRSSRDKMLKPQSNTKKIRDFQHQTCSTQSEKSFKKPPKTSQASTNQSKTLKKVVSSIPHTPNSLFTKQQKIRRISSSNDKQQPVRPGGLSAAKSKEMLSKIQKPTKFKNSGSYPKFERFMSPAKPSANARSVAVLPPATKKAQKHTENLAGEIYGRFLEGQVRQVAGSYVQSVLLDHLYRKTLKKVVRMMLFGVIQECVDMVYYIEEDTISTANLMLERVIQEEATMVAISNLRISQSDSLARQQVAPLDQAIVPAEIMRSKLLSQKKKPIALVANFSDDDDQMIRDDEDCLHKQSNIQKSITNSHYNSPRMDRKGDFQAELQPQQYFVPSQHSFLKSFNSKQVFKPKVLAKAVSPDKFISSITAYNDRYNEMQKKQSKSHYKPSTSGGRRQSPHNLVSIGSPQHTGSQSTRKVLTHSHNLVRTSAQKPRTSLFKHVNAFSLYPPGHHLYMDATPTPPSPSPVPINASAEAAEWQKNAQRLLQMNPPFLVAQLPPQKPADGQDCSVLSDFSADLVPTKSMQVRSGKRGVALDEDVLSCDQDFATDPYPMTTRTARFEGQESQTSAQAFMQAAAEQQASQPNLFMLLNRNTSGS